MSMKMRISKNSLLGLFKYYGIITFILSWIAMYTGIRNGVIITVLISTLLLFLFILNSGEMICIDAHTIVVVLYISYNLIMVIVALVRGYHYSIIFSEVANTIVPIFVYFIGKQLAHKQAREFENYFCVMSLIILVVGLIYNIRLDDPYYIEFLARSNPGFTLLGFKTFPRINSVLGSVICGTWGCIGICFSYRNLIENRKKQFWILYGINVALAILSLQRSAMICAIIFSLYFLFRAIKQGKLSIGVPVVVIIAVIVIVCIIFISYNALLSAIMERFFSIDSAVSERSNTWKYAFENGFIATLFGVGVGTGGQRAIGVSNNTINDGNYFKIIYEIGIIGIVLLSVIIYSSARKCNDEEGKIYSVAIYIYLLQMLGSNTLTFQVTAIMFWYIIGRTNADSNRALNV